jgi:uncharacterized membrane protein
VLRFSKISLISRFRLVLGAIAIALVAWLVFGSSKPWQFSLADQENWKVSDFARYYSFWAAILNVVVLAALILSARWWASSMPRIPAIKPSKPVWFWPLVIGAVLFSAVCAGQRMNFGFAHDEDYSARRVIAGSYKEKGNGDVVPEKLKWTETFYYYRKPNNHPLHSILSRVCHTAMRAVAPGSGWESWKVREWVIRIPAYLAGVGAIAMMAVFLRRLHSPLVAVIVAWLMALHPWHIRYASEARGYSLLIFFIPVVLYFWLRATQENRWRWWLLFGLAEFLLIYSYPGAAYILVVLNLATAAWLVWKAKGCGSWTTVGRWFAVNCFAGMIAWQLMLPLVPQLQEYMKTGEARLPLTYEWHYNTATHFLTGTSWSKARIPSPPHPEVKPYAVRHPVFFGAVVGGGFALLCIGYAALFFRKPGDVRIAAATLLFPGLIGYAVAKSAQQWLFEWYLIYLLPGLIVGVAVGAVCVGNWLATRTRAAWVPGVCGAVVVLGYAIFSQPFRAWYCENPLEPVKESVLSIRGTLDPNAPIQKERLTGIILGKAWYYDTRAEHVKTPEEFIALLQKADRENKPLYFMVPHPWAAVFNTPKLWRLFNEAGLFENYQTFIGFDETHNRVVAKYVPKSAQGFDIEAFFRGREATPDPYLKPLLAPNKPVIQSAVR